MSPNAEARSSATANTVPVEAIRVAVNIAQCECVCQLHLCFCLLTDTGRRELVQPFLYEPEHGGVIVI